MQALLGMTWSQPCRMAHIWLSCSSRKATRCMASSGVPPHSTLEGFVIFMRTRRYTYMLNISHPDSYKVHMHIQGCPPFFCHILIIRTECFTHPNSLQINSQCHRCTYEYPKGCLARQKTLPPTEKINSLEISK